LSHRLEECSADTNCVACLGTLEWFQAHHKDFRLACVAAECGDSMARTTGAVGWISVVHSHWVSSHWDWTHSPDLSLQFLGHILLLMKSRLRIIGRCSPWMFGSECHLGYVRVRLWVVEACRHKSCFRCVAAASSISDWDVKESILVHSSHWRD
jgi:hypothetical protein